MIEKRFLLEQSDYDLKYEFSVADLSRVEKTKEDFWNEEEEIYNYRGIGGYLDYLYENNAFLTEKEADKILNELNDENEQLKKSVKRQQGSNNECAKLIEEQQKENEQLQKENRNLRFEMSMYEQKIEELEKELKE